MKKYNVNVLQKIKDPNIQDIRDISDVFEKIKNGVLKEKIEAIRSANDKAKINLLKESLPSFTVSATFNDRRIKENVKDYNGLIHLDYDGVDNPEQLKDVVSKLETTYCAFISPSGNGLKVFVKTNSKQSDHSKAFKIVNEYYKDITGVESDQSVKDLTRLCFVSYDSKIFINENSKVFDINEAVSLSATNSFNLEYVFNSTMLGFHEGSRHNVLISCAGKANRLGIDKDEVVNYFKSYTNSTFNLDEVISSVEDI